MKKVNKKINYALKIMLLLCMVFAEVASPIKVLAEELTSYNFNIVLDTTLDSFKLVYDDTKELDQTKTYILEVTRRFEYVDGKTYEEENKIEYHNVLGSALTTGYTLNHESFSYNGVSYVDVNIYKLTTLIDLSTFTNEDYKNLLNTENVSKVNNNNAISFEEVVSYNNKDYTYEVTGDNITGLDDKYTVAPNEEEENEVKIKFNIGKGNLNPNNQYVLVIYVNDTLMDFIDLDSPINLDFNKLFNGLYKFKVDLLETNTNNIITSYLFDITSNIDNKDNIKDFLDKNKMGYKFLNYTVLSEEEKEELGNEYKYLNNPLGTVIDLLITDEDLISNYSLYDEEDLYHVIYAPLLKGAFTDEDDSYKAKDLLDILKAKLSSHDFIKYEIVDKNGNKVEDNSFITNGMKLKISVYGIELEYDILVYGEVNGSLVDETDLEDFINKLLNDELSFYDDIILDLDGDEKVDIKDVSLLASNIYNKMYGGKSEVIEDTLSIELTKEDKTLRVGDTFSIELSINGFDKNYLNAIEGIVSYDEEYLRLDKVELLESTFKGNTVNNRMMYATVNTYAENNVSLIKLTFTALNEGTSKLSVNDFATYQNGNLITLCTSNELELNVDRALHTDKTLKSLTSSYGHFNKEFNPNELDYTLYVDSYINNITLFGEVNDIYANVTGLGNYTLNNDVTNIEVKVTAENGTSQTYTVKVVKIYKSSNNNLSNIVIDGYELDFDKDKLEYTINVDANVTELDISALVEDPKSWAKIEGNESFEEGENIVTIKVYAEDGSTKTYTIKVNKAKKASSPLTVEEVKDDKLSTEKIIIIILIILVVIGLLYLIFKKDEEEAPKIEQIKPKKEEKQEETKTKTNNIKNNKKK